ncbi:hypothetical protein KR074_005477, partial [Drosophila pseudoananassae]
LSIIIFFCQSLLCGTSNPRGVGNELKQSRDDSRPGEFPWTVAVFYNENVIGAGSIVAPGVVLTAAHILKNMTAADIKIRAGDWDLTSDQESFKPQERLVTLVRKHKEFVYETGANDLAIVFLDRPFQLNNHIRPICLPSQERSYLKNTCIVTGWGVKNYRDPYLSHVLKAIELPLVDRVRCQDQLRQTKLGPDFELDPSVICAGGEEGVDSCTGDGGSAIICQVRGDRNRYVQVGIVNWGVECGKKDVPAVYTNLEIFNDWIDQQLKNIASPVG